ncbi:ornithine carbamoyltransferase [Desulfurococcus amylolyticus]|uniref:Ornithine carbamoyltransferase n=1 Tax=Desulfurococcus amylolyticus DSM 16532 TaxID=768672 RepID=I3XQJ2_DESAM|nr:ornithine carbamoyltransferase [Desulfurococcus amylolyticus]AFL66216.1 Ornithine carbamoyltransferase [Desulfurococcus amylolyticus DSM 16532]
MPALRHLVRELSGRDLISTLDWSDEELEITLRLAKEFKEIAHYYGVEALPKILERKIFYMLFFAPSTRTRAAFESAMVFLGGHAAFIDATTTRMAFGKQEKAGEAVKDVAAMYDVYGHGLGIRILDKAIDYLYGVGNAYIREMADAANIPVINMADDKFHPTQGLADIFTFRERFGNVEGKKYVIMWAYSPEIRGWCSVQEDMILFPRFGVDVVVARPPGFDLDPELVEKAKQLAREHGSTIEFTDNLEEAVRGAHAVFPRNWASPQLVKLGYSKFKDEELKIYEKYKNWKVTRSLMDLMDKHGVLMHVLPIFRGYEADDEVIDDPRKSIIYEQAENGLWTKMAVLALTMYGVK